MARQAALRLRLGKRAMHRLILMLATLLPSSVATAQDNQINAFNRNGEIRIFDDSGQALGVISTTELVERLPIPLVSISRGRLFGFVHDGRVVYVRGLDIDYDLEPVSNLGGAIIGGLLGSNRDLGRISAGTTAGGGAVSRPLTSLPTCPGDPRCSNLLSPPLEGPVNEANDEPDPKLNPARRD